MIFDELSNAVFRLSLRFLGAELEGGGGVRRPPIRWWKIQRPIRGEIVLSVNVKKGFRYM